MIENFTNEISVDDDQGPFFFADFACEQLESDAFYRQVKPELDAILERPGQESIAFIMYNSKSTR